MLGTLFDFFGGTKITEKKLTIRSGKLKIMLKERDNEKYIYLRFSYPGNIQYHALHKENIDEIINTLVEYRRQI